MSIASIKSRFFKSAPSEGAAPSSFSHAFKEGILAGGVVMILMAGWMWYRADDTARALQDVIPSKTASIEIAKATEPPPDPNAPAQGKLEDAKTINALPAAPVEGLFENYEGRKLPISRIKDDMTPFEAYKRPFQPIAGRPMVSFVVLDFGLSTQLSKSILDNMPPDVTLVMTPYADEPSKWAESARTYGHELWLDLPMQTQNFGTDDSGPNSLLLNVPNGENEKRLFSVMSSCVGYVGLVSQKDHVFTAGDIDPAPIMKQIFGRGVAFAESNPGIKAYGLSMAMEFGYPYVQNNFWLDADLRPEAIDQALKDLELQATQKGKAIAFLHPLPVALNKVQEWIKEAEQKGIQVAPLSAMVQ